jgi:histidine ammonia-lyase
VLAIETIAAFQAMEFLRPLRSSASLEAVRREFRRAVRPWNRDREMHADIESARRFLADEAMGRAIAGLA